MTKTRASAFEDVNLDVSGFAPKVLRHLALGLHLLVTRDLAGRVLDGALDLVGGTFDVFAIHDRLLSKAVVA